MHENIRVETFISELRHYRSHFLITNPSTMKEVIQTVTKKKQWNKCYTCHSDSDSETSDSSELDTENESSDNEDNLKPLKRIL